MIIQELSMQFNAKQWKCLTTGVTLTGISMTAFKQRICDMLGSATCNSLQLFFQTQDEELFCCFISNVQYLGILTAIQRMKHKTIKHYECMEYINAPSL